MPATTTGPAVPVRRTQSERRATTRSALLRATVDCLTELGYAATTTNEVQRRAGVSRGALTHHFASKAELMLAAMDLLYDELSGSVRSATADLPQGRARIRPAIELIWQRYDGPLFTATMELWTAARTDPDLRASLLPHERRLGRQLRALCAEVFGPEVSAHPHAETVYHLLLTSMRGQAMTYALNPGAPRDDAALQHWFSLVEAFSR